MRARNLKPSFFKNEALAECSPLARLLFAGLWCLADREGRLEDRPKRIRAELLPYDDGSVDDLLSELHDAGFILRYSVAVGRFIQVVNFTKHQYPHRKEQASTIPAPDMPEASPVQEQGITGTCPAESLIPPPEPLIPSSDAEASVAAGKPEDGFEIFWKAYPRKEAKGAALKAWEKIKSKSETLQAILVALEWQRVSTDWTKDGGQFIPQPPAYLNKQRWLDEAPPNPTPAIPFDRAAYEAKRKAQLAADREAYMRQEGAATVPVGGAK